METHAARHKREDRKATLIDRLISEHTVELIRPDDVTCPRFAIKAHISKDHAKALLEELAEQGKLKRITVKHHNGSLITAYRE